MAILPFIQQIALGASGSTPDEKIESLVRQLNEWQNLINQTASTFKAEIRIPTTPQWDGMIRELDSYDFMPGTSTTIDFRDWEGYNWYWQIIAFTDAGEGFYRLYNDTDGEAVPGSELSTTAIGQANATTVTTDILTKYTGIKTFRVQIKNVGGDGSTQYANLVKSYMLMRIEEG